MWHLLVDILRNSILITGLVVVMMMMIESLNIESKGLFFKGLRKTKIGQVVIGALLGSVPGCMGGFATVSLYTHRMFSFGALVAMMIASSGDEAFIMLAMIPDQALILFAVLFVIAVIVGIIVDRFAKSPAPECEEGYKVHEGHEESDTHEHKSRHFGWKRISMFVALAVFIGALATGQLGHDVMNELHARGYEGIGSDIAPVYSGIADGSPVTRMPYQQLDITDHAMVSQVLQQVSPDVVVHCAAWTAVDLAEDQDKQEKVRAINAGGTRNIAQVCKALDCKMVYISTDYVFNGQGTEPWQADCKDFDPLNYYGQTKLEGELAVVETLEKFFIVEFPPKNFTLLFTG